MKYIAVDKDYQEAFAHILERLSVEKDDDIVGMATTVLVGNGQWISFFWNCSVAGGASRRIQNGWCT